MSKEQNRILSAEKIEKILKRIAIQVIENNYRCKELIVVGIVGQGYEMAKILQENIKVLNPKLRLTLLKLEIDKLDPATSTIKLDAPLEDLKGKTILLVDDVINTGRTQAYSLSFLLGVAVEKVDIAVLVSRSHTAFPISVNYSGIALSTTIDEHIQVQLQKKVGAYLYS